MEQKNLRNEEALINGEDYSEDFSLLLGGPGVTYTWDDFNKMRRKELAAGEKMCPQASTIALQILTPNLLKMPWRSQRTNSETYKDFLQDCWLLIASHIAEYDEDVSKFPTFMSKWFSGLARETRDDGMTDYQKKKGYRVYSEEAMAARYNGEGDGESSIEYIDEGSAIEDIMEVKERQRVNELLHQMMTGGKDENGRDRELIIDESNSKERRALYQNMTCISLFLGGPGSMSEDEIEYIENALRI